MNMYLPRVESDTGQRPRCAHSHCVHTLHMNVPMDALSTPFVPTTVGAFEWQGRRNVEHTHGSTHDAPGVRGIMPLINQDMIRCVLDTRTLRGPTWARACIDRVEGFDLWPHHVRAAVQAAEREALE